jgi:large subunit ribosomal protein L27e
VDFCSIPIAAPTANTQYATGQLLTYLFCSLKVGRVVIITRGRYAGKKCVIISPLDNGTKSHPFPHALVAGIERYPSKVTRRMSKNKQAKKSKVKPFVKQVNCM